MPDVLRVQRPRLVHVARSLDDRSPIGEYRKLVPVRLELEQEAVVADLPLRLQVPGQFLEVQAGGAAVRYLHGVAAAQARGVRPLLALQPLEVPPPAARAIDRAEQGRDLDAPLDVLPHIDVDEVAVHPVAAVNEDFER